MAEFFHNAYDLAVGGGFLGALKIDRRGWCPDTSAYVGYGTNLRLDVWKALADGAWTSSTTISVYAYVQTATVPAGGWYFSVSPAENGTAPASQSRVISPPIVLTNSCPAIAVGTVIFYDDGTFSVS